MHLHMIQMSLCFWSPEFACIWEEKSSVITPLIFWMRSQIAKLFCWNIPFCDVVNVQLLWSKMLDWSIRNDLFLFWWLHILDAFSVDFNSSALQMFSTGSLSRSRSRGPRGIRQPATFTLCSWASLLTILHSTFSLCFSTIYVNLQAPALNSQHFLDSPCIYVKLCIFVKQALWCCIRDFEVLEHIRWSSLISSSLIMAFRAGVTS